MAVFSLAYWAFLDSKEFWWHVLTHPTWLLICAPALMTAYISIGKNDVGAEIKSVYLFIHIYTLVLAWALSVATLLALAFKAMKFPPSDTTSVDYFVLVKSLATFGLFIAIVSGKLISPKIVSAYRNFGERHNDWWRTPLCSLNVIRFSFLTMSFVFTIHQFASDWHHQQKQKPSVQIQQNKQ